jgi:hypothetical protein
VQLSQAPGINISIHDDETDDDIGKWGFEEFFF